MPERVLVIGSGVIGLGVALRFAAEGHAVSVFSDTAQCFPTSPVAAAFWYPYACSMTDEQESLLALPTLKYLAFNSSEVDAGIEFRNGKEYFDVSVSDPQKVRPWWSENDVNFSELADGALPDHIRANTVIGPFVSGWSFQIPVVNMRLFLPWLERRARELGVTFRNERIKSLKTACAAADVVVNCSGGWATWLTPDPSLVAYQGVVLEVPNEPFGDELIFIEKGNSESLPTYIVPQRTRTILGGTLVAKTDAGARWPLGDKALWQPSQDEITDIIMRCNSLVPGPHRIDPSSVAFAALRPRRQDSPPRIELDSQFAGLVIHCYGHGGSGLTTFWGSAELAYGIYERAWANKALHKEPRSHAV